MDIVKGFFQQTIRKSDRWKTAFVTTHRGHEQLTVSTMGLANSPGFFQHRMETIFGPYLWQWVLVYIDDIIIFSRTIKDHLAHLGKALQLLEQSGVSLSISKCHFGYPSITALGHHVSRLGLSTVQEKTEAIRDLDYPQSLRQLETGLGFLGYYRKFVEYYAAIAEPLMQLKTAGFKAAPPKGKWRQAHVEHVRYIDSLAFTDECKAAWDTLKDKLCTAPTLMHLDFSKGFILYCDGSKERGYGAALHQKDNEGIERPILYLSKTLDKHERNYWSTELEVGALVWALSKLKQYTDAGELTVIIQQLRAWLQRSRKASAVTVLTIGCSFSLDTLAT